MEAPRFEQELTDLASGMGGALELSHYVVESSSSPDAKPLSQQAAEAWGEIDDSAGDRAVLQKFGFGPDWQQICSKGNATNRPMVVVPAVNTEAIRDGLNYIPARNHVATIVEYQILVAVLGHYVGMDEDLAKQRADELYAVARSEVYVSEGGQVIVGGKVIVLPGGKGELHLQRLAPQGSCKDLQIVLSPAGSSVIPYKKPAS